MDKETLDIITKSVDSKAWYAAVMMTDAGKVVDQTIEFFERGEKDWPDEKKTPHDKIVDITRRAMQGTLQRFPETEWESLVDLIGKSLKDPKSPVVSSFMTIFGLVGDAIARDYNIKDPISDEQIRSDIISMRWPLDQLHEFWSQKNEDKTECGCPFCKLINGHDVSDEDIVYEARTRGSVAVAVSEYVEKNMNRLTSDQLGMLGELKNNVM